MKISIDSLREVTDGNYSFNALLQNDNMIILTGWRIMKGKIYSPAVKTKTGYFQVCFLDNDTLRALYDTLAENLTPGYLESYDKAVGTLRPTQRTLDTFLPTLTQSGGLQC